MKTRTKLNVAEYLEKNLKDDPAKELILEYISYLEKRAESLDKIRASGRKYIDKNKEKKAEYNRMRYLKRKEAKNEK